MKNLKRKLHEPSYHFYEIVFLGFVFGPFVHVAWILQIVSSSLFIQLSDWIPITYA
jgi:hypothetical protein